MEKINVFAGGRNKQLARIVESCLECEAAYKLFDMLSDISRLETEAKLEYLALVRDSGAYTEEEIDAIKRLIMSGTAQYFKDTIDQVRDEQIQREIDAMIT